VHPVEQLIALYCSVGSPGNLALTACYLAMTRSVLTVVTEISIYLVIA
jgi:hypothetical protein